MQEHARNPASDDVIQDGDRLTIAKPVFSGGRGSAAGVLGIGGSGIDSDEPRIYGPQTGPRIICDEEHAQGGITSFNVSYRCEFFPTISDSSDSPSEQVEDSSGSDILNCKIVDKSNDLFDDPLTNENNNVTVNVGRGYSRFLVGRCLD